MGMLGRKMVGEYITDLDMTQYLNYVVSTQPLKGVPAFDSYNVDGAAASGENEEFGNAQGSDVNFTSWSAEKPEQLFLRKLRKCASVESDEFHWRWRFICCSPLVYSSWRP